jgi:hypothetical protein
VSSDYRVSTVICSIFCNEPFIKCAVLFMFSGNYRMIFLYRYRIFSQKQTFLNENSVTGLSNSEVCCRVSFNLDHEA